MWLCRHALNVDPRDLSFHEPTRRMDVVNGGVSDEIACNTRLAPSASTADGFSHKTGLPAPMQASVREAWVASGEAITTAWTSGEAISSRPSVKTRFAPHSAARVVARVSSASITATTVAFGTFADRFIAWRRPIAPTPMTPTRRASFFTNAFLFEARIQSVVETATA